MTMPNGKRQRDSEVDDIKAAFQGLLHAVDTYERRIAHELEQAKSETPVYQPLVSSLERQLEQVTALRTELDDEVIARIISIANTSGYVSHARTRAFF